jgi:2-polyprenyl-6-methoxyphenol hydroxylase-like FAD-dependent oxidoreductase
LLSGVRIQHAQGQRLTVARQGQRGSTPIVADLIVGADGRASACRRTLGLPDERTLLSYMAGALLEDAELPFEGFGHVFLGGPGPMFACRIGPRHLRICLDVPLPLRRILHDPEALGDGYAPALPPALRPAFRRALHTGAVAWTANQSRPRLHYGRAGFALVGDAVGHFHPLTAMGLASGFLDGLCLAESRSFGDYRRRRAADSYVPELLAGALYKVFTCADEGTAALRHAVFAAWRQVPGECSQTMRLLSGAETSPARFLRAFVKVLALACRRTIAPDVFSGRWRHAARTMHGFGPWVRWLAGIRSQRSEVRSQRSEVRGQRSEVRGQRSEIRHADS